jgi:4a-hydroxytetrahydrobiopterin dehydratase
LLLGDVPGWELRGGAGAGSPAKPETIARRFRFADFLGTMAFVGKMAALAEEQGHHPDFCVHYSEVEVTLWTHSVGGLSENDFIMAAKINEVING